MTELTFATSPNAGDECKNRLAMQLKMCGILLCTWAQATDLFGRAFFKIKQLENRTKQRIQKKKGGAK